MKRHPIRRFIKLRVTLPLDIAEALAAGMNGTPLPDRRARGFRRQLNAALRKTSWISRLERRHAAAGI